MGRVYLRLSDLDFWGMEPRVLFAMLKEYHKIDIQRMKLKRHIANGGEIETDDDEVEPVTVHPDAF